MTIRNDFPDFGQAPTFITHNPTVHAVASASTEIARFDTSSYQYGVLYVGPGGTVVDNDLSFQWLGAVGAEASIIAASQFCRMDNGTIVIPFQALSPTLALVDVFSSTYPYNISVAATLYTSPPYQHGYPGGIFAINTFQSITMGGFAVLIPDGCGPGTHLLSVNTASTDWDAYVTIFPQRNAPITVQLVSGASGPVLNQSITLPATQWILDIDNNDADTDFTVAMSRTPNPQ